MRVFLSVTVVILLVLVILLGAGLAWLTFTRQPYEQPFRPDAPQFGQRGDYTVGYQTFTITGNDRPLNIWVWYPAQGEQEQALYSEFNGIFEASGVATANADPVSDGAPFPLVVFSHGNGSSPLLSTFFTEHLASHGFIVIGVEHNGNTVLDRLIPGDRYDNLITDHYIYRPQDVTRVIDYAIDNLNQEAFAGLIDTRKIAISGHSFGGYTAFASAGAVFNFDALQAWCDENAGLTVNDLRDEVYLTDVTRDYAVDGICGLSEDVPRFVELAGLDETPSGAWESLGDERISAVVALAPFNAPIFGEESLNAVDVPTLIVVGSNDTTTFPERDAYLFYEWLGSDNKTLAEFVLGDHALFIDFCPPALVNAGFFGACSDPVWDLGRAHDVTNHLSTAFLRGLYYDDSEAASAIEAANIDFAGIRVRQE